MTPLQAVRASNLTDNVMECIRHVVEKHDAALLEVAIELRKENEALRALLREARERETRYVLPLYRDDNYMARIDAALGSAHER